MKMFAKLLRYKALEQDVVAVFKQGEMETPMALVDRREFEEMIKQYQYDAEGHDAEFKKEKQK